MKCLAPLTAFPPIKGVPAKPSSNQWLKVIVLLAVVGAAIIGSKFISREQILNWLDRARDIGPGGYALFVLAYGVWSGLGLPASIPTLAAAAAFGFWRALFLVLIGANLSAWMGFLTSRYVARDWFAQIVGKRMVIAQIDRAVAERGWKVVMLTRMPPVSPFSIVNYAYGLTSVKLRDYAIGTAIGIIPGTSVYVYLGSILGSVAHGQQRQRTPLEFGIYVAGFILTIFVCVYLVRLAKSALQQPLTAPAEPSTIQPPPQPQSGKRKKAA